MATTPAKDISRYQGAWQDTGEPIVMIKMSGGDAGLYMDSDATNNYDSAVKAGKAVGGYHFIGWTIGAPQEASFFLKAMQPLAENDVYALDIEAIPAEVNPVPYVEEMVNFIHSQINVWPLVYMNLATLNAYDWSVVLANCGLWLADWAVSPDANIPTTHMYIMQQYSDGPKYDHDMFFGTVDQFKEYGYHAPTQTPQPQPTQPTPAPAPAPAPTPEPTPQPTPEPVFTPTPTPFASEPTPAPVVKPAPKPVVVSDKQPNIFVRIWDSILRFFDIKV